MAVKVAAKEATVEEKLKSLFHLQTVGSKLDKVEILKGELPIEVKDLEDDIVGLETRIERLKGNVDDINTEVSRHNNNIKESEMLIERYEKQLDNVKNNREYDALSKEIELQKLEIQLSQKKISETGNQLDIKQSALQASENKYESRVKDLDAKKVELDKILTKTEKEEAKLLREAKKVEKNIEPRLLKAYHRIRTAYRNGLAVVSVERGACGGCFNRVPPQTVIEISSRKTIVACEHCSRVLVDDIIAGKVEEVVEA